MIQLQAALFEAARPVLLTPPDRLKPFRQDVLVGWNASPGAFRALTAALPLLSRMHRVVLLTIGRTEPAQPARDKELLEYLARHGVRSERMTVPPDQRGSVGPDTPHTAYSAAKFAVKGFTEALIADFRMNAPHLRVSVVMPGHIGTGIRDNSLKVQTHTDADGLNAKQIAQIRTRLTSMGRDTAKYSDADIERLHAERARRFVTDAPTSAVEAAKIILHGVKADRLRILVGPDAHIIDRMVREDPDHAYEPEFYERFATEAGWYSDR